MRSSENKIRSTPRKILAIPESQKCLARAPTILVRFRTTSTKWLFAFSLIFTLALGPNVLFAQSGKASASLDTDACEKQSAPLIIRQGLALIRVSINHQPMTFIVDSGGMTIINSDRVSLPVVQQIRTGTITISATQTLDVWNVVHVKSFTVGAAELRDSKILSRSLRSLEAPLGQELDGIFGNDALRLWDSFSLDYNHKVLVLQRWHCTQPQDTESLWRLERDALRLGK
jgi:hypothetical protein